MSVKPDFRVTNENAPAVAAIAARLHGMPLAIELAAARIKLFSPDALRARLEDQLGLLSAGARDLPERQQTLRGAIAWSYDMLDDGHRRLLDRLSVFEGGIDLAAAEAVCGPTSELGIEVVDGLVALADQSLIRAVETTGDPRFHVLDTIHEYAAEKLAARGETDAVAARHGDLVPRARAADRARPRGRRPAPPASTGSSSSTTTSGRCSTARRPPATRRVAIGLAFAVWRFWQKRGHLSEARRRLDAMNREPWSRSDPILRARLLEALGGVCWWQADIRAMRVAYTEAVELWRSLGDRSELANALYNRSFVVQRPRGDRRARVADMDPEGEGDRNLAEALVIYRELGDAEARATCSGGSATRSTSATRTTPA